MRLATVRTPRAASGNATVAVRVEDDAAVVLPFADVQEVLANGRLAEASAVDGERLAVEELDFAPVIPFPNKIICVGLNYADHIAEMGNTPPEFPTYFSKFSGSLIGAHDDLELPDPDVSTHNDWEAELCVVVGASARNVAASDALDVIAGYTVFNDFSVRDFQRRTSQFLAGKTFERASGLGPVLVTTDELGDGRGLAISSRVNGVVKQSSSTDNLVFGPAEIIEDVSRIITLLPGDLIATGTPGGVGAARTPPEWLRDGDELTIEIERIGALRHAARIPGEIARNLGAP